MNSGWVSPLKLWPQLVPKPLWRLSCANLLPWQEWNLIRQDALTLANSRCEVCGAPGRVCHEVWAYDDDKKIATLTRFEIHCDDCDAATHMGRALKHRYIHVAVKQLCLVNGMKKEAVRELFAAHMATHKERSRHQWKIVVDHALLQKYPQQLRQFSKLVAARLSAS